MKPWQAGARFAGLPAKPWHGGAVAVKVAGKSDAGLNTRLVQFKLTEPEPLLYHA
jgi:4-methylaminobutanoate oxidase (formaldehyde-forming)